MNPSHGLNSEEVVPNKILTTFVAPVDVTVICCTAKRKKATGCFLW